jgi:hypothetical protein
MSSVIRPLEDVAPSDVAYWLAPGGRDNGVWADTWVVIADLDADDTTEVLNRLAEADIGGYAAIPGGRRANAKGSVCHSLWVDLMQYHRAEDVLMLVLRERAADRSARDPDLVR